MLLCISMDPSIKMFVIGLAVGLILAVAWHYFKGSSESYEASEVSNPPEPVQKPQLVLFYMNGCGHCEHLMPIWNKLEEQLQQSPIETSRIELSQPEAQGQDVKGAPTIRYFPMGMGRSDTYAEYSGDRSLEDLLRFCKSVLEAEKPSEKK